MNCSDMKYTMVRKKGCLCHNVLLLQLCSAHAIVYVFMCLQMCTCHMHAFVNVCVCVCVCVCMCVCVSGGVGETKLSFTKDVMSVKHEKQTFIVLIQTGGGTLMWEEVTTDLC